MKSTGNRIQAVREARGMSRAQLAKKLRTSRVRVWRLETGITPIHADYLPKVAKALDSTVAELVA